MNTQVIAIANQKGGVVGKTTACANLGIGLEAAPSTSGLWLPG